MILIRRFVSPFLILFVLIGSSAIVGASTTSTHFKLQRLLADNTNEISLIVSPHGKMTNFTKNPGFYDHKREFRVEFYDVSLGEATVDETPIKLALNKLYLIHGNPYASYVEFTQSGRSLEMTIWLKPRVRRYVFLTAGGFMLGYTFRR